MKRMHVLISILALVCIFSTDFNQVAEAAKHKKIRKYKITKQKVNKYKLSEEKSDDDQSSEYIPPQRIIQISPYFGAIYGKDLFTGAVKDGIGWIGGVDVQFQIYKNFGLIVDGLYSSLESQEKKPVSNFNTLIYTGGFYYRIYDLKINLCYGAIASDVNVMTIFMPGIQYSGDITSRLSYFIKLNSLITNDWIVNEDYKEKYKSFMLASGLTILF